MEALKSTRCSNVFPVVNQLSLNAPILRKVNLIGLAMPGIESAHGHALLT